MKYWKRTLGIFANIQLVVMAAFVYWAGYSTGIEMNLSSEQWQYALWFIAPIVVGFFLFLAAIFHFVNFSKSFAVMGGLIGAFVLPALISYAMFDGNGIFIPVWLVWSLGVTMALIVFMYVSEIWRACKKCRAQNNNLQ